VTSYLHWAYAMLVSAGLAAFVLAWGVLRRIVARRRLEYFRGTENPMPREYAAAALASVRCLGPDPAQRRYIGTWREFTHLEILEYLKRVHGDGNYEVRLYDADERLIGFHTLHLLDTLTSQHENDARRRRDRIGADADCAAEDLITGKVTRALYDTAEIYAATPNQGCRLFGTSAGKTRADASWLAHGGLGIPSPNAFVVKGLGYSLFPQLFNAGNDETLAQDRKRLLAATVVRLVVGNREYWEGPLSMLPVALDHHILIPPELVFYVDVDVANCNTLYFDWKLRIYLRGTRGQMRDQGEVKALRRQRLPQGCHAKRDETFGGSFRAGL